MKALKEFDVVVITNFINNVKKWRYTKLYM